MIDRPPSRLLQISGRIRATLAARRSGSAAWRIGEVVLLCAALAVVSNLPHRPWMHTYDLSIYRNGAQALLDGLPLYDLRLASGGHKFTYPLFAAVIFVPLASIPKVLAAALVAFASVAALVTICMVSLRAVGVTERWSVIRTALMVAIAAAFAQPVTRTLDLGQVNLILTAVVIVDLLALRGRRAQGLLVGLATGIKLTPGVFIVYFYLTGQRRAAITATVTTAVTVAIGFLAAPGQAWAFWTRHMVDPTRVGVVSGVGNQSLLGELARLMRDEQPPRVLSLGASVLAVALTLWMARRLHRARRELLAVCVVAVGSLLASPISWDHHWVWFVPCVVAMVSTLDADALRHGSLRAWLLLGGVAAWSAVFVIAPMYDAPNSYHAEFHHTPWQAVLAAGYLLCGVALLAWAMVTALRSDRPSGIAPEPAAPPAPHTAALPG